MRANQLMTVAILATLSLTPSLPLMAENPPATTYQSGYWQPVARFDTKKQVEVKLINSTDIPLEYDITNLDSINPQILPAKETGVLKDFGNAANIVIYPKVTLDPDSPFTLKFKVDVSSSNIVTVTIEKAPTSFFGHRSLELQKTGAIYLY